MCPRGCGASCREGRQDTGQRAVGHGSPLHFCALDVLLTWLFPSTRKSDSTDAWACIEVHSLTLRGWKIGGMGHLQIRMTRVRGSVQPALTCPDPEEEVLRPEPSLYTQVSGSAQPLGIRLGFNQPNKRA